MITRIFLFPSKRLTIPALLSLRGCTRLPAIFYLSSITQRSQFQVILTDRPLVRAQCVCFLTLQVPARHTMSPLAVSMAICISGKGAGVNRPFFCNTYCGRLAVLTHALVTLILTQGDETVAYFESIESSHKKRSCSASFVTSLTEENTSLWKRTDS